MAIWINNKSSKVVTRSPKRKKKPKISSSKPGKGRQAIEPVKAAPSRNMIKRVEREIIKLSSGKVLLSDRIIRAIKEWQPMQTRPNNSVITGLTLTNIQVSKEGNRKISQLGINCD